MIDLSEGATIEPGASKGYEQVVAYLSEEIEQGRLNAGDRIPPERALSAQLNISRPVVREALRALAMIGVLEIEHGRGTFVRTPDIASLRHFFSFLYARKPHDVDDVMDVRRGLERQAIRLACVRADAHDFDRLTEALAAIRPTIGDPNAGGDADFLFHTRLVEASHSPALIQTYAIVSRMLARNHVHRRQRITSTPHLQEYIIDHHRCLLEAIQQRDVEQSERLLGQHFEIGDELAPDI